MKPNFFRNYFRRKCSPGTCATFSGNMVSVSVMGFEKFAAQVGKVGTCHEICEKKTSPYGHLAQLVPQKRHHMGNLAPLVPQKRHHMGNLAPLVPQKRSVEFSQELWKLHPLVRIELHILQIIIHHQNNLPKQLRRNRSKPKKNLSQKRRKQLAKQK